MVERGTVALAYFPFSAAESQPFKKRPVLVLGSSGVGLSEVVVIAMITGSQARINSPGPGDLLIADWQECGLAKESLVRSRRFWAAEERDLAQTLGTAPAPLVDQVAATIKALF